MKQSELVPGMTYAVGSPAQTKTHYHDLWVLLSVSKWVKDKFPGYGPNSRQPIRRSSLASPAVALMVRRKGFIGTDEEFEQWVREVGLIERAADPEAGFRPYENFEQGDVEFKPIPLRMILRTLEEHLNLKATEEGARNRQQVKEAQLRIDNQLSHERILELKPRYQFTAGIDYHQPDAIKLTVTRDELEIALKALGRNQMKHIYLWQEDVLPGPLMDCSWFCQVDDEEAHSVCDSSRTGALNDVLRYYGQTLGRPVDHLPILDQRPPGRAPMGG